MSWFYLVVAGLFEMSGVAMIPLFHKRKSMVSILAMASGFGLSFIFLTLAMETIPMATAYSVWTGIGAAGGALLGMVFFNESAEWKRIGCIILIISAAVGLKLLS
ncbi:DMT family transporter [Halobacillus sp. K22]|uniref:DMT family transporter n=1 Tax=Halobacillus sp. K22 TaxID=3457431 RepID=UPI003FCE2BF0